jgi:dTDP-4-amino-4,6-dideoxygalactose transaminase
MHSPDVSSRHVVKQNATVNENLSSSGSSTSPSPVVDEGAWKVPLADVRVTDELVAATQRTVTSGWWSMGPRVAELEESFAAYVDAPHALAVANGTAALHVALLAVGCGPGDEVVLPSINFVAAANTIVHTGAKPVFCDIRGDGDLNLDPADLEAVVGPATKAIALVHFAGFACDLEPILELARQREISVIEDAAHAPGSRWNGRACGTIGDIGCFSFFSNKNLPVGEGGMVVTSDDELAESLRLLRSHGMTTLTWDRHRGHASSYDVVQPGFNYRLDELRAAIGLVSLARLDEENAARREIALRYRDALEGQSGLALAFADRIGEESSSHHLAIALLPPGVSRDEVRAALTERRVQTSVHYPPIHRFAAYREQSERELPRTEEVESRLLTLPLFGHLNDDQLELVTTSLLEAVERQSQ